MTTTLRPAGPERHEPAGVRTRPYTVCVNGRPVGAVEVTAGGRFGPAVGHIGGLAIDEPDRRRGRATVAALAAEEVLRSWGCRLVEVAVPAGAPYALRLAAALGYSERSRHMAKDLGAARSAPLPPGSSVRPLRAEEYVPLLERGGETFAASLAAMGVPREEAEARESVFRAEALPGGVPAPGTELLGVTHEGLLVAYLWLRTAEPAWVFSVEVEANRRGRGHGRTAMLAAEDRARAAGSATLGLNVFVANTPAVRLYESLGYRTTDRRFTKPLV